MLSPLVILCLWLSPMLSQTREKVPKLYQFHPYQQPLHHSYHQYQQRHHQHNPSENRRHQRTLLPPRNLRNPAIKLRSTVSSKHFSSPSYRFTPQSQRQPVLTERQQRLLVKNPAQRYQRKPILINPSSERLRPRIVSQKKQFQVENNRETRKIANIQLKLGGKKSEGKKKYNLDEDKKDKKKLHLKNDNLAIESKIVETKVKVPKTKAQSTKTKYETKPPVVKKPAKTYHQKKVKPVEVPIKRTYNSAPAAPKFIIKQAGPSQQFGWVGHGTYAPLDIPNIFKAAGINTRWIPEVNEIFEAGLTYPVAPAPVAYAQDKLRIEDPIQETKPVQSYSANAKAAPIKVKIVSVPVKTPAYEAPAAAPAYKAPAPATAYKASQSVSSPTYKSSVAAPAPAYKAPASTYEVPALAPAYKAPVSAPSSEAPAPAYKAPNSTPSASYSSPAPVELPAQPPVYTSQISYKASKPTNKRPESYESQSINLFSSSSTKAVPFFKASTTTKPIPTYKPSTTYTTSTTQKPSRTYKPSTTPASIFVNKYASTAKPFYGSPSPSAKPFYGSPTPSAKPFYGSPTPSIYKSSPGYFVQPSYKPSTFFRSTNKPFTAFIGSPESASPDSETLPLKKIEASPKFIENKPSIKLEKEYQNDIKSSTEADDGEVFYIFYENEENPLDSVKSGLDLQRYIHEEIQNSKDDSYFSASEPKAEIFEDDAEEIVEPVFNIVEEFNKPKQPVFFDVPIKIEENGEGFDPPSEIRTIFVPVENAINVPDTFDISVGTSFGYNKNTKDTFPNFSSESDSSYNNPISSYDAPIAPSSNGNSFSDLSSGKDTVGLSESPNKKSVRRIRKPKPKSIAKFSYDPVESSLSAIPYGSRLGPRDQYDPLIIKR